MVQGGAANSAISEKLIESVVEYIIGKEDLLQKLDSLLILDGFEKKGETSDKSDISKFLMNKPVFIEGVMSLMFENFEKNKVELEKFIKLADKTEGMEKELEALGNQLLAQGVISGAAVTTLTGALAVLLTVGGVTGALIVGGAALVGFVALVAIAAIGYAIYQHRGEIKEGAMKAGKEVKSFVKDVIDKLPTIQARENNFRKLISNLTEKGLRANGEERTILDNKVKIIEMLRNQEQKSAIQELVKDGDIKEFSKKDMERLLQKGLSTHLDDQKPFDDLIDKFQPAIMKFGNDKIEELEKKVNEKVAAMKPSSKVKESNSEQVDGNNIAKYN
ncbi:glycine zipper family protein [Wolbachia endosymbiont of Frankliniella intonsa]|uniref:glycine zipper family protein n=1 Tax=Wolbachia endosymbiont of Frankliniella intonsa TaxID=2902422 RepID=UPI00244E9A4D|nr:glycine zipper family protein [Wolbachia endosymbiont of Frankliniella intonsa]WGJ62367.1 glycine zipper family protein [Wolbachia endosymbiont of Frankliniella intonsa]